MVHCANLDIATSGQTSPNSHRGGTHIADPSTRPCFHIGEPLRVHLAELIHISTLTRRFLQEPIPQPTLVQNLAAPKNRHVPRSGHDTRDSRSFIQGLTL